MFRMTSQYTRRRGCPPSRNGFVGILQWKMYVDLSHAWFLNYRSRCGCGFRPLSRVEDPAQVISGRDILRHGEQQGGEAAQEEEGRGGIVLLGSGKKTRLIVRVD